MRVQLPYKQKKGFLGELRQIRKLLSNLQGNLIKKSRPLWVGTDCDTFCGVTSTPVPKKHAIAYLGKPYVHPGVRQYVIASGDFMCEREVPKKYLKTPQVLYFRKSGVAKGYIRARLTTSDWGSCCNIGDASVLFTPEWTPPPPNGFLIHE